MFLTETAGVTIDWNELLNNVIHWCMTKGMRLLLGVMVVFFAFKFITFFTRRLYKKLQRKQVDETLSRVGTQVLRTVLKGIVLICFIGFIGIETASITALIASCGVAVGLALQGSLSNLAGGVIIILMRPFRIGDFITSSGESGTVENIHMFYTVLVTPDNKTVHIPNGNLANDVIVNFSAKETRRVEVIMSIAYESDFDKAVDVINAVCATNDKILKEPLPYVTIGEYADSYVDLSIRVWVNNKDYWPVHRFLMIELRKAFEENGLDVPYNQLEVTLKK